MTDAIGTLSGLKVLELGGIGPGPFAGMILADHGADVLRLDRPGHPFPAAHNVSLLDRNKRVLEVNLKAEAGLETARRLVEKADVTIEGWRPGVAERLGLGPSDCLARNPRLIYGRMTGWGQDGPMADKGGHDINYIALSGALGAIGKEGEAPTPPLNLIGDFAGGGLLLAFGIMAALWELPRSGQGQVIDSAMVDGAALLMTIFFDRAHRPGPRGTNLLDGGCPMYGVYETSDGRYMAAGALDPPFFGPFFEGLGLDPASLPPPLQRETWPELRGHIETAFATRTQQEWVETFNRLDACVTPVLDPTEVPTSPYSAARGAFEEVDNVVQPVPAPRFSRTPGRLSHGPLQAMRIGESALEDWGVPTGEPVK